MFITVEINNCSDCNHLKHSGAFTPGGARPICQHPDATRCIEKEINHVTHTWKQRVIHDDEIPKWCPLKHGSCY